jgi:hypothetical protein
MLKRVGFEILAIIHELTWLLAHEDLMNVCNF